MSPTLQLRAGAWYGDYEIELAFPDHWTVETFWPHTPDPLTEEELEACLEHPVKQPPLRELGRGKTRPVILVDDLTRPTPANHVLALVLRQLQEASIPKGSVTIVVGGGTHRPASLDQAMRKLGPAADGCRVVVHDQRMNLVRLGTTSYGTPVIVNREVATSDLLIGIAGVYPQHSVGFGGGSKLLLGALGRRSIMSLHYGHSSVAGTYNAENDFRRDLDEMSRRVRLDTIITLHVDANRNVVRAVSGDHHNYYRDAVAFSKSAFAAPLPGDADVVIANAYPMDVSLTFARSKGLAPLSRGKPGASRVLIAACSEGLGYHGLFPFLNGPRFEKQIHVLRRLAVMPPRKIPAKVRGRLTRLTRRSVQPSGTGPAAIERSEESRPRSISLYAPGALPGGLPDVIPGMSLRSGWGSVLDAIATEQGAHRALQVAVYPCSPLHCLDLSTAGMRDHLAAAASR